MKKTEILAVLLFFASGCANGATRLNDAGYSVYTWTAPRCPSDVLSADREMAVLGIFGDLLIGTLIDAGLGLLDSALADAAKQDKDGWSRSGKSAAYLYGVKQNETGHSVFPAACIVVAYAKAPTPAMWCGDKTKPIEAMTTACSASGKSILEALNSDFYNEPDDRSMRLDESPDADEAPRFYAEIKLTPSTDGRAVRPEVLQLHYPQAFRKRRGKSRNLILTSTANGVDGRAKSVILVTIRNIEPKATFDDDTLLTAESLWAALPAYDPVKPAKVDLNGLDGMRVGPVNLVTEIRETGEINRFLQAFATAFSANKKAASAALKPQFTESGRDSSFASDADARAGLQDLKAKSMKAGVDVLLACNKGVGSGTGEYPTAAIKEATIEQLQAAESASKLKASALARKNEFPVPFANANATQCP